jgi:AraC-like DNA-binding protein
MAKIVTYNCNEMSSQRLFIKDLREYLQNDDSYLHFIKGTILCFCRRGTVKIRINYKVYDLSENDVLAILPTHVFYIEESSDGSVVEAVLYTDEYWASSYHAVDYCIIKDVEYNPHATMPDSVKDEAFTLLELIKKHEDAELEHKMNQALEQAVAWGLAFSLLMLLVSLIELNKPAQPRLMNRKDVLTHDFFELLSTHYETERQVAFYASKLCVTPKHLSTMVKEVTHLPILEWINNITILNIKRRLLTSTDTVQQISEDLNFQTPSTFVRYFRQHTGVTPSRYRNHHRSVRTK